MSRRGELLEFAVLGLLHESPMHGYELRKRLNTALGAFRALSYGSLYPCLRDLLGKGWIFEASGGGSDVLSGSRRARIVYELTADGKERFQDMAESAGAPRGGLRGSAAPLPPLAPTKLRGPPRILRRQPAPAGGGPGTHPHAPGPHT